MSRPVGNIEDRFWNKVDASGDCWVWTASKHPTGYGAIWVHNRGMQLAHRISYELLVGPIPDGLFLDHLCRVRGCVNPDHLEPVTHQENVRRGIAGVTAKNAAVLIKACPQGHPYELPHLYVTKEGRRACRTCRADSLRRTRARRRIERAPKGTDEAYMELKVASR